MSKAGIDDLIAAHGPEIVRDLIADAWKFDGHPRPEPVHLSDIENAALGRKRLSIDLMVSAVGDTYLLPKTIVLRCFALEVKKTKTKLRIVKENEDIKDDVIDGDSLTSCAHCQENDGFWEHHINSPEILIDLTRTPARQLRKRLQELATSLCPHAVFVETRTRQTVTSFLATPKARKVRSVGQGQERHNVDETGKPFREKVVFYLGKLTNPHRYYRAIGVAVPNPKSQEATAFLWKLQPIEADYQNFTATPETIEGFTALRPAGETAWQKLRIIGKDVTNHITHIYGAHRELAAIGKLLVFHSVLQFKFDGKLLKRGWLELVELGDTGQGKTQQVDELMRQTGLGESVDGVSTTRTGLAYSFQKFGDSWFLVWGKYPLNDGRLLFVDEAQKLRAGDIDKIRKGRSDAKIEATGVRSGEHPTRTRLIMSCNPRRQGVVDDQLFGIELLKETFKDEDIRRFDFAIISSSSDDKADINRRRSDRPHSEQLISGGVLAQSIRWAWSRQSEDIVFEEDATDTVFEIARVLTEMYGDARDIPLALESDVRIKVARIAVAVAALLHSSDEAHQKVIVCRDHVEAVSDFLTSIYNHANCSFGLYARIRRSEARLSDDEYDALWDALRDCRVDGTTTLGEEDLNALLRAFVTHGGQVSRPDLAGELGKSPEWTSKVVRVLKVNKMIRVNKGRSGGYRATPRFTKFLKLALAKKQLNL